MTSFMVYTNLEAWLSHCYEAASAHQLVELESLCNAMRAGLLEEISKFERTHGLGGKSDGNVEEWGWSEQRNGWTKTRGISITWRLMF